MDKTSIYDVQELKQELILIEIDEIISALEEKGYVPINQIVGYLLSGDQSYITSFDNSRKKITKYKRSEILAAILQDYLDLK